MKPTRAATGKLQGMLRNLGVPLPGQSNDYDVAGKVVLITGGGAGIGRALARLLHTRGATVALLDRDSAALAAAESEFGGKQVLTSATDVRDREAMDRAIQEIAERAGGIDVVVAGAGVAPQTGTIRQLAPEQFDRVIDINITGVFNTVRPALDHVIARGGHVVVISSAAAFTPGPGGSSYMISKAGVEQLGRALRLELAPHGATAGVVYFGIVDTQMTTSTFDDGGVAGELQRYLPRPFRQRLGVDKAAMVLAEAITHRAGRSIAPAAWKPLALLNGVISRFGDGWLAGNRTLHTLIRQLEQQDAPEGREQTGGLAGTVSRAGS